MKAAFRRTIFPSIGATLGLALIIGAGYSLYAAGSTSAPPSAGGNLRQAKALSTTSLLADYPLDGTGTDISGNGNNLTTTGSTFVTGKFGQAINATTAVNGSLSATSANFTFSFWFQDNGPSCNSHTPFSTNFLTINCISNAFGETVTLSNASTMSNTNIMAPTALYGQWHLLTIVLTSTTGTVYMDGTGANTASFTSVGTWSLTGIRLGGNMSGIGTAFTYAGYLDDLRIYTRALSAAEVLSLVKGSNPTACDQTCKAYYKMDEDTSSTLANSGTGSSATLAYQRFVPGHSGNAINTNGYLYGFATVPNNGTTDPTGLSFTESAWIYWRGDEFNNYGTIFDHANTTGHLKYNLTIKDTTGTIGLSTGSTRSTGSVSKRGWHLVTYTYTASSDTLGDVAFYIDGVASGSAAAQSFSATTSANFTVGSLDTGGGGNTVFGGLIDDARVYNYALSSTDVANMYAGSAPSCTTSTCLFWYKFDESSGTTVADSSGNGNDGTVTAIANYIQWTSGNFGSGLYIDGSESQINLPDLASTSGTLDFWLSPASNTGDQRIFMQSSGASSQAGMLALNQTSGESGSLWVWDGSAWQRLSANGSIAAGQWSHIVVEYNGSTATAYINGSVQQTATTAFAFNGVTPTIGGLFLGTTGGWMDGTVDDFRFYTRLLSPEEIADQYRLGS